MGPPFSGLWTFKRHPWTREPHDSDSEYNIGQKAAQMGFTEILLNVALGNIDLFQRGVLYILPASTPDATDFSASRFDPAIELSDHLGNLFSNVKNVGHKRAGAANLFIRGSRSKSGLKSNPCPIVIFDEVDEMVQDNIPLAYERASGQEFKQFWKVSTPTVDGFGINQFYEQSKKKHYFFKCPKCSKHTELIYPDCLFINEDDPELSYIKCKECSNKLEHELKTEFLKDGEYVAENPKASWNGWWVPQLYSTTIPPSNIAKLAIKGRYNPASEQELYNSKLGLPHVRDGARINDLQILDNIKDHIKGVKSGFITMGVDVGSKIHFEIDLWSFKSGLCADINMLSHATLINEGWVNHFEELDTLMKDYQVLMCVIDANPERRKAYEFALRFRGHVYLCFYGRGLTGKKDMVTNESHKVTVDRTSWMDLSLGRFGGKTISLPKNLSEDYKNMIKIPARIYEEDADGNPIGRYVGVNDHSAHARTYNEIALPLAASIKVNRDVRAFL